MSDFVIPIMLFIEFLKSLKILSVLSEGGKNIFLFEVEKLINTNLMYYNQFEI